MKPDNECLSSVFSEAQQVKLITTHSRVYGIAPLKDMHLRSPSEPFDERQLARDFIDTLYVRKGKPAEGPAS
jgi:hypothetical protein